MREWSLATMSARSCLTSPDLQSSGCPAMGTDRELRLIGSFVGFIDQMEEIEASGEDDHTDTDGHPPA